MSGRHWRCMSRNDRSLETQLVYQISPSDVMRTLNSIEIKDTADI